MSEDRNLSVKEALKLLAMGGLAASSLAFPGLSVAYSRLSKEWTKYKKGDIGRIVKRFHKQELIKLTQKDNELIIELSDKGKTKLLKYDFENIKLPKKRDGKMHIVIFDIPNIKKMAREIFRQKLKELGFKMVQRSVFLSFYQCQNEIEFLIHTLEIADHVILIKAEKVELGPEYKFISGK